MQPCVMRPWRSTWVASTITRPAPQFDSMPRCAMCQSVALPSSALYWHIGDTTMRLASSSGPSLIGENRADMEDLWDIQNWDEQTAIIVASRGAANRPLDEFRTGVAENSPTLRPAAVPNACSIRQPGFRAEGTYSCCGGSSTPSSLPSCSTSCCEPPAPSAPI